MALDLEKLCLQTVEVCREVAAFLRKESQGFDKSNIEHKGLNDLVSYVDREAEKKLVAQLSDLLPESEFLTEEDPNRHGLTDKKYHWVIDPLDGTTNFMHGIPVFAISVALLEDGESVVGVVYEVNRDEAFYAWKGGGAYCNKKSIQVSPVQEMSESLLATGFPYRHFDKVPSYLDIIKELMMGSHGLRRMGSAAVDLSYVAIGRFEAFFEYNLKPWDVAAGALIVKEAGGVVSTFNGGTDFIFGQEILAACSIHPSVLEVVQKHWPGLQNT